MRRDYLSIALKIFFAVVYFLILLFLIQWVFRFLPWNVYMDLLAIACCVIALIASVGLAHYTVEKIRDKFGAPSSMSFHLR